jgi:predicted DNA-binding transcriptional regulator AlpA
MERKYLTHGQAEHRYGVAPATINRWVKKRGFPKPVHIGDPQRSRAFFPLDEVEAWDAEQRGQRQPRSNDRPPEAGPA